MAPAKPSARRGQWETSGDAARVPCGPLTLVVELVPPSLQFHHDDFLCGVWMAFTRVPADAWLETPDTFYRREDEIVAAWSRGGAGALRWEMVWRLISSSVPGVGVAGEWLLSATPLAPEPTAVEWELRGGFVSDDLRWRTASEWVLPRKVTGEAARAAAAEGVAVAYSRVDGPQVVMMVGPGDAVSATLEPDADVDGAWRCTWRFGATGLEKGVIRRWRIRWCVLPSGGNEEAGPACYDEFRRSPAPLQGWPFSG